MNVQKQEFPMYRHDVAQWLVSGKPSRSKPIHVNATTNNFVGLLDRVKRHSLYDKLMAVYDVDWWLYEKVADNYPQLGENDDG